MLISIALQIGIPEVAAAEIRRFQVTGADQGPPQAGPPELGLGKIHPDELGPVKLGPFKMG